MRATFVLCAVCVLGAGLAGAIRDRILHRPVPKELAVPVQTVAAPVAAPVAETRAIALSADRSGHFHTDAVIDGRSLKMLVDTGATLCAFTEEDAARAGLRVAPGDFTKVVETANGIVKVAPVRIGSIRIAGITVRDVDAVVVPKGRLSTNLLGMSFLRRLREFQIANGTLTLRG